MAIQEMQLGQQRNGGSATSIYSPGAGVTTVVKSITVCNTTSSATTFSIFLDDDGTTYTEATALFYGVELAANETVVLSVYWPMADAGGNLAVQGGDADAVTFTVFGLEIS